MKDIKMRRDSGRGTVRFKRKQMEELGRIRMETERRKSSRGEVLDWVADMAG